MFKKKWAVRTYYQSVPHSMTWSTHRVRWAAERKARHLVQLFGGNDVIVEGF